MAKVNINPSDNSFLRQLLQSPLGTIIASVLATFIIAAIFFKFSGPVPLSIQQTSVEKQSTFDVVGEGSASAIPDVAEITLGITISRPTVADAQKEANRIINSIHQALKNNGVEERNITTQNYSVSPQYNFRENRRITGYLVSASLRVKITDFAQLSQAIDSAVSLGANQVGGINFTLSDAARAQAETQAREQAVTKAKTKAKDLARATGIKLGRIINVQESAATTPPPVFRALETTSLDEIAAPEPTQIEPGSTEVKLTVTLSYETL